MNYPRIDRPTEPGLYWLRHHDDMEWRGVHVYESGGCLLYEEDGNGWPVGADGKDWRGPIPEPQE